MMGGGGGGVALKVKIGAGAKAELFVRVELRVGAAEDGVGEDVFGVACVGEVAVVVGVVGWRIGGSEVCGRGAEGRSDESASAIMQGWQGEREWIRVVAELRV